MEIGTVGTLLRQYGPIALARGAWREVNNIRRAPILADIAPVSTDPPLDNPSSVVETNGAVFEVRPLSSDHGIINETWGAYVKALDGAGITEFADVLDLGAHIGGFTVQLALNRHIRGVLRSVEAHPENFVLLTRNVARNSVKATLLNAAVSDSNAGAQMAPSTTNNTGGHHLTLSERRISIPVATVDARDLIVNPGTTLKIDIEGWELPVLRRLRPRLHLVSTIVGELHSGRYAVPSDSVRLLEAHGFAVSLSGPPSIPTFIAKRYSA